MVDSPKLGFAGYLVLYLVDFSAPRGAGSFWPDSPGVHLHGFRSYLLDQGFADAIVQRAELDREHLDTAFWIGILTGDFLTTGSFVVLDLVAKLSHEPQLALIVR